MCAVASDGITDRSQPGPVEVAAPVNVHPGSGKRSQQQMARSGCDAFGADQ
jgi:hypothetical protein